MSFYKIAYQEIGLLGLWWYVYYYWKDKVLSWVNPEYVSAKEVVLCDFMSKSI